MVQRRAFAFLLAALLAGGAVPALAAEPEGPMATAPKADPALTQPTVGQQIDAYLKSSPALALPDDGVDGVTSLAPDDRVHGEVSVAVGSHGYRTVYARADIPIKDKGEVSIAVQQSRSNGRVWGPRNARDLGVSLRLGDGYGAGAPLADDCRRRWREGDPWPPRGLDGQARIACATGGSPAL